VDARLSRRDDSPETLAAHVLKIGAGR
jgi:hypothetical protein